MKKDNFKRISENRVSKILALFLQLRNLTNLSFYEYTDEEIIRMFTLIDEESKKVRDELLKVNARLREKIDVRKERAKALYAEDKKQNGWQMRPLLTINSERRLYYGI